MHIFCIYAEYEKLKRLFLYFYSKWGVFPKGMWVKETHWRENLSDLCENLSVSFWNLSVSVPRYRDLHVIFVLSGEWKSLFLSLDGEVRFVKIIRHKTYSVFADFNMVIFYYWLFSFCWICRTVFRGYKWYSFTSERFLKIGVLCFALMVSVLWFTEKAICAAKK